VRGAGIFNAIFYFWGKGSFYQDGISIGCSYTVVQKTYILFMGWQVTGLKHWRGEIGRLVLESNDRLLLCKEKPVLISFDDFDPVSLSYPWVISEPDGTYHMWYGSTYTWNTGNGDMLHVINHATSADGDNWQKKGLALPYEIGRVQAFSRPTVAKTKSGELQMWFSYRGRGGDKYRIGYAEKKAGGEWEILFGKAGIDVSPSGWDSEMIEYPFVFDHDGERYMLYNGNDYGRTGFGLAILEQD
jgi:hypothetical protein